MSEQTTYPDRIAPGPPSPPAASRRWLYALALPLALLSLVPAAAAVLLLVGAIVAAVRARRQATLPDLLPALRLLLVGSLTVTIFLTWDLWQTRAYPPMLDVSGLPLPQLGVGVPLLAALVWSLYRPRLGVAVFAVVLAYSFLADQTRVQPEMLSLSLLLVTTVLGPAGPALARTHLASMWCWAGVHKLLSLDFLDGSAQWMFAALPVRPAALGEAFGWIVAGLELGVGILVAVPRTRRFGVALALFLHGAVLYVLSPLGYGANEAVWPWNLALPLAAVAVFWPRPTATGLTNGGRRLVALACVVLALFPAGFYAGVVDDYAAHGLYADDNATAYCAPACTKSWQDTESAFGVPLPPEPRLYRAYFDQTCTAGERLVVSPRRVRILVGRHSTTEQHDCPRPATPEAPALSYLGPGAVINTTTTLRFSPPPPPPGTGTPLVRSFSATGLRRDLTGWVGMRLRVGPKDLQVTALGRWVVEGNSASHRVKLVEASTGADVPGASVTVDTAGAAPGSFVYAPLPAALPAVLRADASYYLVSEESAEGDAWYDYDTHVVTGPEATHLGAVFSLAASPSSWNAGGTAGMAYGPVSLLYR
ncbi:MAG: DoxX family protein [Acidimicrobiales bacterium]